MKKSSANPAPVESKIPPVLKSVELLTWDELQKELDRLIKQFGIVHDLPKVGDEKPHEYMHETLELMRQRCIAIHWRAIELNREILRSPKA